MNKRGSGLLLVLTVIVALGTIAQDYRFNTSIAREQSTTLAIDRELGQLERMLVELRAAQAGYVAAGQGPDYWMGRVSEVASTINAGLDGFSAATVSAEARTRYANASRLMEELMRLDGSARSHVAQDQRLFASDIIFLDALETASLVGDEIRLARDAEQAAGEASIASYANLRLGMNGLALGFVLIVMVYFARSSGGDAVAEDTEPASRPSEAEARAATIAPPPPPKPAPQPSIAPPLPKAEPAVSLSGAADLCVDLARLLDSGDLEGLMERAARVLYAKGLVLWMVDADGRQLRPTLAHGYSDRVLARLGPLEVSDDNVTSMAFRTLQPQRMRSPERGGAGAVAVPLINANGGVGVLSAEMKSATPDDQMMAVARIVAAQLSSIVSSSAAAEDAEAADRTVSATRAAAER